MSSLTISDRQSLANITRELGHPVTRVERLEVRPEAGPAGSARVTASLEGTLDGASTPPAAPPDGMSSVEPAR